MQLKPTFEPLLEEVQTALQEVRDIQKNKPENMQKQAQEQVETNQNKPFEA